MHAVAVLGHGVVGSGVVELILSRGETLRERTREDIFVKRILDIRDFSHLSYAGLFTGKIDDILDDPEIEIVVEVMGGLSPAFEYVREALLKGKSVVTSNKELVAEKGAQLLGLARERGVKLLFEASVGGGIPLIRTLHQSLVADDLVEIAGVLNGTTNFILTRMIQSKMTFEDALCLAREKGFAEADPSADIEGLDTCRKICILASMACGKNVSPQNVKTEGITGVTPKDALYARSAGYVIKLLGEVRTAGPGGSRVSVGPALVPEASPLGCVCDEFNAILIRGKITGDILISGRGAGKEPTAGAVIGDIVQCVLDSKAPPTLFWSEEESELADFSALEERRYLRIEGKEAAKAAREAFGGDLSFLPGQDKTVGEEAFLTPPMTEAALCEALERLKDCRVLGKIRVRG
ncbi:MAG: homoserine dehydrogenase [Oscillospiraceae bacterium]|jgi:homoserine dehydrogenase|nr:homoserine dehydrogenase [Oscillospiraceae bacterium]